jgi:hypothetical protein
LIGNGRIARYQRQYMPVTKASFSRSEGQHPRSARGKVSVHDRLGGRVNEQLNNRVEEMSDSLVPDEDIMCRAPEHQHTPQLDDEGPSKMCKKPNPQWCSDVLTKYQKRRLQRLRQLEQQEEAERHVLDKKKVRSKV